MSEHIKGKIVCNYHEQSDAYVVTGKNGKIIAYHCSQAVAEHIVKCWNCHDELVAACEKGLEICDIIDGLLATDKEIEAVVEAMKRPIQAVLANAKREK